MKSKEIRLNLNAIEDKAPHSRRPSFAAVGETDRTPQNQLTGESEPYVLAVSHFLYEAEDPRP